MHRKKKTKSHSRAWAAPIINDRKSVRHNSIGSLLVLSPRVLFISSFLRCAHENETRQYHKLKSSVIVRVVEHLLLFHSFSSCISSSIRVPLWVLAFILSRKSIFVAFDSQTDKSHFVCTTKWKKNKNNETICMLRKIIDLFSLHLLNTSACVREQASHIGYEAVDQL